MRHIPETQPPYRCVLHGSFRKHMDELKRVHAVFTAAGIEVLTPTSFEIACEVNGFAQLRENKKAYFCG